MSFERIPITQNQIELKSTGILTPEDFRNSYMVYESVDQSPHFQQIIFGDWLKSQLEKGRISQRSIGKYSGVNHSTFSRLTQYESTPTLFTAAKILDALDIDELEAFSLIMGLVPKSIRNARSTRLVHIPGSPVLSGTLGEQMRGYRQIRGYSLREAEIAIGNDHSSIIKREQYRAPLIDQYAATAYAYGLNVNQNFAILEAARLIRS